MKQTAEQQKVDALATYLEIGTEEAEQLINDEDYLVLTDGEADDKATEYIADSLWAFRPEFLAGETGLPEECFKIGETMCEGANGAILAMVKSTCGISNLVESAISADGRGHFLSPYDGEEGEQGEFYIYRVN